MTGTLYTYTIDGIEKTLSLNMINPESNPQTKTLLDIVLNGNRDTKEHLRAVRQLKRLDWEEYCRQEKEEVTEIERYCYSIRGETPDYERPFEDEEEIEALSNIIKDPTKEEFISTLELQCKRPAGMTDKEFEKQRKRARRLEMERRKQHEADQTLEQKISPWWILSNKIDKVRCNCKAENMRQGIICDTCKLLKNVDDYMMNLFKEAARK